MLKEYHNRKKKSGQQRKKNSCGDGLLSCGIWHPTEEISIHKQAEGRGYNELNTRRREERNEGRAIPRIIGSNISNRKREVQSGGRMKNVR